jgi:hypothetical protein
VASAIPYLEMTQRRTANARIIEAAPNSSITYSFFAPVVGPPMKLGAEGIQRPLYWQ